MNLRCPSPTLQCLLYLLNINLKRFWNNILFCSFLTMTMRCTSNVLGRKKRKNDPTIERGKTWIPFIKSVVRPTSTPSPKRDQLVDYWFSLAAKDLLSTAALVFIFFALHVFCRILWSSHYDGLAIYLHYKVYILRQK
jgi:hypothetical protein